MASVEWYWAKSGGSPTGPMSWDDLRAAARRGEFGPGDWVWTLGYGRQWQSASGLEALFASIRAEKEAAEAEAKRRENGERPDVAPDEPDPSAAAEPDRGEAPGRGAPAAPLFAGACVDLRDHSPFSEAASDGRPPEVPRSARSLRTAWKNMVLLLGNPFSFRRYAAFAFCAFLLLLGGQSAGTFPSLRIPGFPTPAVQMPEAADPSGEGGAGLAAFAEKWTAAPNLAAANPDAFLSDFATALQATGESMRSWMAALPSHPGPFLLAMLLFLAIAAMHAWFLSRGWALMIHRVYRRDEPVVRTWIDTTISARRLFRGAFAVRLVCFAAWAVALWKCAGRLALLPVAVPPLPGALWSAFAPVALVAAADSAATALLRDLVTPRVVLTGSTFSAGAKSALSECGLWTVRHLLLLGVVAPVAAVLAALVLRPFLALAPVAFPVLAALVLAPYQLLRSLWALDLFFRLHPEARVNVPPRMAVPPGLPPLRPRP